MPLLKDLGIILAGTGQQLGSQLLSEEEERRRSSRGLLDDLVRLSLQQRLQSQDPFRQESFKGLQLQNKLLKQRSSPLGGLEGLIPELQNILSQERAGRADIQRQQLTESLAGRTPEGGIARLGSEPTSENIRKSLITSILSKKMGGEKESFTKERLKDLRGLRDKQISDILNRDEDITFEEARFDPRVQILQTKIDSILSGKSGEEEENLDDIVDSLL